MVSSLSNVVKKSLLGLIILLTCSGCLPHKRTCPPSSPERDSKRVTTILSHMTLEEKLGQLFIVFFQGHVLSPEIKEMILHYHIGGIVLYKKTGNIEGLRQLTELINTAQKEALSHGAKAPLFVAIDQEGGSVSRLTEGVTLFPGNMAIGASGSLEDARLMAEITARELRSLGINMNFAPVIDVNNNPLNPIIGIRSFGASPERVACFGRVMIEAYKAQHVIPTAKHFPGHGDTSIDSHRDLPIILHPLAHLEENELLPFREAVKHKVPAIMTAHVAAPALEPREGLPATMSYTILTELIREKWKFEGLIITDSLGMGAIDKNYGMSNAAAMAFKAGADILLFGADQGHEPSEQRLVYDYLLSMLHSGELSIERLDQSVKRILLTKEEFGILDFTPISLSNVLSHVGTKDSLAIAERIAQNSITLVKDSLHLIPITEKESTLIVWPQGPGDPSAIFKEYYPDTRTLSISLDPTREEIALAKKISEHSLRVIVATTDVFRHPAQIALVVELMEKNPIVVALRSPYDLMSFPEVPCYIATYGDNPVSLKALGKILFGLQNPRGTLPVELPGLYSIGHGLQFFSRHPRDFEKLQLKDSNYNYNKICAKN